MAKFYDIDAANALLPELSGIIAVLGEQRTELVRLRDEILAAGSVAGEGAVPDIGEPATAADPSPISSELRLTRLRMQGTIDQMAAGVARIDVLGLTLRDIERGLVDVPALATGRQIWLCWRLGEASIGWWHELDRGFDGRQPLAELS